MESNVNENSNKLQYKLPNTTTGSRGIKENASLKCEVTPLLKEGSNVKEGKTESIEFIENNWNRVKRSFTHSTATSDSESQQPKIEHPADDSSVCSIAKAIYDLAISSTCVRVIYLNADNISGECVKSLLDKFSNTEPMINLRALYLNKKDNGQFMDQFKDKPVFGPIPKTSSQTISTAHQVIKGGKLSVIDQEPYDQTDTSHWLEWGYMPIVRLNYMYSDVTNNDVTNIKYYSNPVDGTGQIGSLVIDKPYIEKYHVSIKPFSLNVNGNGNIANIKVRTNK